MDVNNAPNAAKKFSASFPRFWDETSVDVALVAITPTTEAARHGVSSHAADDDRYPGRFTVTRSWAAQLRVFVTSGLSFDGAHPTPSRSTTLGRAN
jgi:hypothetical protein